VFVLIGKNCKKLFDPIVLEYSVSLLVCCCWVTASVTCHWSRTEKRHQHCSWL